MSDTPRARTLLIDTAVAAAAIVVIALAGLRAALPGGVTTAWFGGGLLIAIFVSVPPRRWWPAVTLGTVAFTAYLAWVGWAWPAALLRASVDVSLAALIALAIRRLRCLPVRSTADVARLAAIGLAAGVVRFAAIEIAAVLDPLFGARTDGLAANALLGTLLGVLVVAPFGAALAIPPAWNPPRWRRLRGGLPAIAAVLLLLAMLLAAPQAGWWPGAEYLSFAIMIWAALTLPRRSLAVLLMGVTLVGSWAVIRGVGPFAREVPDVASLRQDSFEAQALLTVLAMTTWSLFVLRDSWLQTRGQLDAATRRLHAAVDQAAVPMSFGPLVNGGLEPNEAMAAFFEVPADRMRDVDWRAVTHPDDLAEDLRLTSALARGDLDSFQLLKRYVIGGRVKWGQLNLVRLDDIDADEPWTVAQIVDMTAEMQARHDLEVSRQRFRTVVHKASIPMSFGPVQNGLAEVNDARCAFHERTREELAATDWRDLIHPDDLEAMHDLHERIVRGDIDRYRVTQRFLMPDGRLKWGDVTAARLDLADSDDDFVVVQIVDVTAEVQARERLQHLVDTEEVTGLGSRSWITEALGRALGRAAEEQQPVGVMFLDLSEYEMVFGTLGFEAGDELLATLARAVTGALPADYLVGRFWGDRLLMVAPDAADTAAVEVAAARVLEAVSAEIVVRGHRVSRTGSIGIAVSGPGSTSTTMLRTADRALARAKQAGRSRMVLLPDDSGPDAGTEHLGLEHELREALDGRQFTLRYQPQVRLSDGAVCGYEALVRWDHPVRGTIVPAAFMDVMESSGLVVRLGRQVLDLACAHIAATPALAGPVSVNVSAIELMEPDWLDHVTDTLERFEIPAGRLVVELTETTVLRLTTDARQALSGIRRLGVGLHIDDFGAGYASIGVLQQVPLTGLKLDRTFVAPLAAPTPSDVDLVRSIASLARGLRLDTIAEGIETAEQASLLREAGWEIGQGHLYGRPVPGRR